MPSTTSSSADSQLVDVLAIERRDERVLQPGVDLAVDLVAPLLERLDLGDALVEPVVLVDELGQPLGCDGEVFAVRDEQVEELDVPRDQAERHWSILRVCPGSAESDCIQDDPRERGDEAGGGDGDDPGEEDAAGHAPADAPHATRRNRPP